MKKLAAAMAALFPITVAAIPVIPGAGGYGMDTPAGRGGTIYKVTNLESGRVPGSLETCLQGSGPRVCVFEVSGTIKLNTFVSRPYVTVAGQTAPSPGIQIDGMIVFRTHDAHIQHLAFRKLDGGGDNTGVHYTSNQPSPHSKNIVWSNISYAFAWDGAWDSWNGAGDPTKMGNYTIRHNLFAYPQTRRGEGWRGTNSLIARNTGPVTVQGTLYASSRARNPLTQTKVEILNNVNYNHSEAGVQVGATVGGASGVDIINTVGIAGPLTRRATSGNNLRNFIECETNERSGLRGTVYESGNIGMVKGWKFEPGCASSTRVAAGSGAVAIPAEQTLDWVLKNAGSRPKDRHPFDQKVIQDVINNTGGEVNSWEEHGGYPHYAVNHRTLNLPANPNGDNNGNGYTNLEEFLHKMSNDLLDGSVTPPTVQPKPTTPKNVSVR